MLKIWRKYSTGCDGQWVNGEYWIRIFHAGATYMTPLGRPTIRQESAIITIRPETLPLLVTCAPIFRWEHLG